jgi:hypothetical protein
MSVRPNTAPRQARHQANTHIHTATSPPPRNAPRQQRIKAFSTPSSSRSITPSTSLSEAGPSYMPSEVIIPPPVTPTPKKARRPRNHKQPHSEKIDNHIQGVASEAEFDDEEMLFSLLGVTSPPIKAVETPQAGILAITRKDIEGSRRNRGKTLGRNNASELEVEGRRGNRRGKNSNGENQPVKKNQGKGEEPSIVSEGDTAAPRETPTRKPRNKPAASTPIIPTQAPMPTSSRPIPVKQARNQVVDPILEDRQADDAFETASLTQSLPSGGFFAPPPQQRQGKGMGDESAVWEMPDGFGPAKVEELTVSYH